jgi:hypothetical protein
MGNKICAFMDYGKNECRILSEKVCTKKQCSFFKTYAEFEQDSNRDFLHESYAKGAISEERYLHLLQFYHKGKKKSTGKGGK